MNYSKKLTRELQPNIFMKVSKFFNKNFDLIKEVVQFYTVSVLLLAVLYLILIIK